MACILYSCLLLSLAVLFHKTYLMKLAEIEYLKEGKTLKPSAILSYQSSMYSEADKKEKRFHKVQGKITNDYTILLPLYQVGTDKNPCIILSVDAILSLKYLAQREVQVRDIYVPNVPEVTGNCSDENEQNLALSWGPFVLTWFFVKLPDKGWWFLSKIELKCDPSDLFFDFINSEGISYTLSSSNGNRNPEVAAPIGKTFVCSREISLNLSSSQINMVGSLYLRSILLKPFIDNGSQFHHEYFCPIIGSAEKCKSQLLTLGTILGAVVFSRYVN